MTKILDGLHWVPKWVSELGALKGCVNFLKLDLDEELLYGGLGYAFIIHLSNDVCPSGPTAFHHEPIYDLAQNLGLEIDSYFGIKTDDNFDELKQEVFEDIKDALDNDVPCYGWDISVPEYYVIKGYDEKGNYIFTGPMNEEEPDKIHYSKLGETEIGILNVQIVEPGVSQPIETIVKEAFKFALKHSENDPSMIDEPYSGGIGAYDNWIDGLKSGRADSWGMAYNGAVWYECRQYAVKFLKRVLPEFKSNEIKERLERLIVLYKDIEANLHMISAAFPFPPKDELNDALRISGAVEYLKSARESETEALQVIKEVVELI